MSTPPRLAPLEGLPDGQLLQRRAHVYERGFFLERWNHRAFTELGLPAFVQDNHSRSSRGTLRGLHYQAPPHAQGKLISVIRGRVFDVAVDLRSDSPTRGRWAGVTIDGDQPTLLWIPPGFAHGFLVLSDTADVLFKVTADYAPESEGGLTWDDLDLAIEWPLEPGRAPILKARDANWPRFAEVRSPF